MIFNFFNSMFNIENGFFNLDSLLIRSLFAFIFAFIFSVVGLKYLITYLKKNDVFQPIRVEGPQGHLITKQKTPTMGGLVSCLAILSSGLLFCNLTDIYVIAVLVISMSFGIIGLTDDIMKVFYKNTNGFKGSIKLIIQTAICGMVILWLASQGSSLLENKTIFIPYFKISLYLGFLFIPFILIVILGTSNGVNITDGLDGLAIVPIMLSSLILGILAIFNGYGEGANIITTLNQDNISELAILCFAVIGAGMGFFLYNKYPAKIFMGDAGSLMYGSFLGSVAVMLNYEIFFGIIGLLFAIEASSSTLQVISYRVFKRKMFKMAPIHHHFEKIGWSERKIIVNFWAFSLICLVIGLLGIINF